MLHNYNLLYIISNGYIIYNKFFKCIIYRTVREFEHLGSLGIKYVDIYYLIINLILVKFEAQQNSHKLF